MSKLNLTEDQNKAAELFLEFLFSQNERYLIIEGIAGTGKTFLLSQLIDRFYPSYLETCKLVNLTDTFKVPSITATTNKAVGVLVQQLALNKLKQYPVTIYNYLGLVITTNYATGTTQVKKKTGNQAPNVLHPDKGKNTICVIDEASMVDRNLLNYLNDIIPLAKIVFIGDPSQLLKVGSTSPIYNSLDCKRALLDTPVRNKGLPELANLYLQFHNTVNTQHYWDTKVVPGIIEHITDENSLDVELYDLFGPNSNPDLSHQVLTYTNDGSVGYSHKIREMNNRTKGSWDIGEEVITNNLFFGFNNDTYNLAGSSRRSVMNESNLRIKSKTLDSINIQDLVSSPIDSISPSLNINIEVNRYCVEDINSGDSYFILELVDKDSIKDALKYLTASGNWYTYFAIRDSFATLRLSEASTIHKSQGSTYHTVIIDLDDIGKYCKTPDTLARLLYVAVSRATNKVIFYGNLPTHLGKFIYD